jgi:hypothetical protein
MKHELTNTLRACGTLAAAVASFYGSPLLAATIWNRRASFRVRP